MTTREHLEQMKDILNLREYYDNGFEGQGVKVCSMESFSDDSHGSMVRDTILAFAPKSTFVSFSEETGLCSMSDDNITQRFPEFVDWCIANKVDIVTSSLDWSCDKESEKAAIKKLYDHGIIFCNCAGNSGSEIHLGNTKKTYGFDKEVIAVSGYMHDIKGRFTYSRFNYGEAVDILGWGESCCVYSDGNPNNSCYAWSGTSASTPMIAGLLALYKSYDKNLNNKNVFDLFNASYIPLVYEDREYKILKLPKLNEFKLREVIMEDKPQWKIGFEEVWDRATKLEVVDGSRPNDAITRNELVVILDRLGLLK